jgi:hypothetical protein
MSAEMVMALSIIRKLSYLGYFRTYAVSLLVITGIAHILTTSFLFRKSACFSFSNSMQSSKSEILTGTSLRSSH